MELKLYGTPAAFLADNEPFLRQYEALSQLNLSNAQAHWNEPCHPGLLFGRQEENGKAVLLFGNFQPWNLCLNAVSGDAEAPRAAAALARELRERSVPISGLNARQDLCGAFLPAYCESAPADRFHLRASMDIMVLQELVPPPAVPGRVRRAELGDLDLLTQWGCAFHREAVHEEKPPSEVRKRYTELVEHGEVFLYETPEGVPVSSAYIGRALPHGAAVSGVYTPPEYRGHGYCQCTVAELCREKLREGNDYCTLFVDQKNPISNRVYEKIGFRIWEDCHDYRLEQEDQL